MVSLASTVPQKRGTHCLRGLLAETVAVWSVDLVSHSVSRWAAARNGEALQTTTAQQTAVVMAGAFKQVNAAIPNLKM